MLYITKANSASGGITFEYLESEHCFGLIIKTSYSFTIQDAQYTDEDDALILGIDALKAVYLRPNLVAKIGLDEFKNGLVTALEIPETNHLREQTASITIEERVRVTDDSVLSNLTQSIPSPQDVESFSETFSSSRGADSYSYSRDINLKYKQDAGSQFIDKARLFIKNVYLNSRPNYGFLEDGISENVRFNLKLRPKITEKFDLLNKEVSFSENLSCSRVFSENGILCSRNESYSLEVDPEGYETKSYDISIKALQEPLEVNIVSGIHFSINSLINENTGSYGNPFVIEKEIRENGDSATLSIQFTKNPKKNGTNNITYFASKSVSEAFHDYEFSIDIKSVGQNKIAAFNQSKVFWSGNYNIGYTKVPALFPEVSSGDLYEKKRSTSFDPFQRSINDKIVYTTDPAYNSAGNILKRKIQISDNNPIQRHVIVPIFGDSEKIGKRGAGLSVGTRTVSVQLVSSDFTSLESSGIHIATGEVPNANYYYLDSKTTSFDPYAGISTADISYIFFD